jgi:soluble lytic murein transglycosylase-like protein
MNPLILVVLGLGAFALLSGRKKGSGMSRAELEQLVKDAAARAGVPAGVLEAIVDIESSWDPSASNRTGGDEARGGAFGLTQLTLKTARSFDPRVTPEDLLDPVKHLIIASKLMADNARRSRDPKDLASMWNSGKVFDKAPEVTRESYVPRFLTALSKYEGKA